ncbi:MAG: YkgJ family cysteine cluster protein [Desulfobacterales bacterium]|nr:YkgJ family cysteine cluster protein [Desulfobacterales bacterium]
MRKADMATLLSRQIKKIEKKESKGQLGQWRRSFCKTYPELLVEIRRHTHQSLTATLAEKGEQITCRKGCTYCCHHYVTVSLAHGIAIVDFLYQHGQRLREFISSYEKWHEGGYAIAAGIDHERLQAQASHMPVDRVLRDTRPLSAHYLDMNIPCSFLAGDICSIYDVRPLSCSGHYAISPPADCAPNSPQPPTVHHLIPQDRDLMQLVRLADARLAIYELSLPIMIHRLLHEGSAVLMDEAVQHDAQL